LLETAASAQVPPSAKLDAAPPEAETPAAERALPFEPEHEIGETRRAILDHFLDLDAETEQTMSQIKAALPHVLPGTIEACVRREWQQGRLVRTNPGVYKLASARPPEPSKSAPPPPPDEAALFDALERWAVDPASWDIAALGPAPDDENTQISLEVRRRFFDRVRKRERRRRDAEAAAARQAEADRHLLNQLLGATGGNYTPGSDIQDLRPIRTALEIVPIDCILGAVRNKTDRILCPVNQAATSWREKRLLEAIAQRYCRYHLVPGLIDAWSKATGNESQKPMDASEPSSATPPPSRNVHQRRPGAAQRLS
jgi:hypothetical protein